jgi:hypothetical protein
MKEIFQIAINYSGEALVAIGAFIIRTIEIKFLIRKKKREWEQGEKYTKIENGPKY